MKTNNDSHKGSRKFLNPETWVDQYGSALYAYALVRVRKPDLAEEIVQETFLAALQAHKRFQGRASEKTWLIGILKHKIVDHFRKIGRERPLTVIDFEDDSMENIFDRDGNWIDGPRRWSFDPGKSLEQKEFLKTLHNCLRKLPSRLAQVFIFWEMEGLRSKEICDLMGISLNNLHVMLYRARLHLRRQLELVWFGETKQQTMCNDGKPSVPVPRMSKFTVIMLQNVL